MADARRPALVIDGGARGDVGTVRSLGLAGIPVHLLAERGSPTTASRFVTKVHPFPARRAPPEERMDRIVAVAQSLHERPVMISTGDTSLRLLSAHRQMLEAVADHDLAAPDVIATCVDKDRFAAAAQRLELPVPDTFVPTSANDVRARAETLAYPVFVKPVLRQDWDRLPSGVVKAVKGQRVDTAAGLVELFDSLEEHGAHRAVVQSLIDGPDSDHVSAHVYVLPDGRIVGSFTGRKLRVWPAHAGVGSFVVSERIPEVVEASAQTVRALGYTGFAMVQFKYNRARGRFELLEINCRHSTWSELPTRCGCNFPATAYAAMTGATLPPLRQREGPAWLDWERDRASLGEYWRAGEWTLRAYATSLRRTRAWAFFAWDDAGPFWRKLRNGSAA